MKNRPTVKIVKHLTMLFPDNKCVPVEYSSGTRLVDTMNFEANTAIKAAQGWARVANQTYWNNNRLPHTVGDEEKRYNRYATKSLKIFVNSMRNEYKI